MFLFILSGTFLSSVTDVELEDSEAGLLFLTPTDDSLVLEAVLDLLLSSSFSFLGEIASLKFSDSEDLDLGRGKILANILDLVYWMNPLPFPQP